jgi:DNA-binding GntR family transcriptional regulator
MGMDDSGGGAASVGAAPGTGTAAPAIVRTSSGEQVALHIRRLIFDGELKPGTRVPQDAIAQALGVSRIPVREALIALEREGWVTIEMHRGAFINALDEQAVRDHYELFGLIYGFAARRAISRSGEEVAHRLDAVGARIDETRDVDELSRLFIAFHATVVEGAQSPRINVALRAMSSLVPGEFFAMVPDALDIERAGVGAVLKAVRKGDEDRAADAYARMMRRVGDTVVSLFAARGLFGTAAAS